MSSSSNIHFCESMNFACRAVNGHDAACWHVAWGVIGLCKTVLNKVVHHIFTFCYFYQHVYFCGLGVSLVIHNFHVGWMYSIGTFSSYWRSTKCMIVSDDGESTSKNPPIIRMILILCFICFYCCFCGGWGIGEGICKSCHAVTMWIYTKLNQTSPY